MPMKPVKRTASLPQLVLTVAAADCSKKEEKTPQLLCVTVLDISCVDSSRLATKDTFMVTMKNDYLIDAKKRSKLCRVPISRQRLQSFLRWSLEHATPLDTVLISTLNFRP